MYVVKLGTIGEMVAIQSFPPPGKWYEMPPLEYAQFSETVFKKKLSRKFWYSVSFVYGDFGECKDMYCKPEFLLSSQSQSWQQDGMNITFHFNQHLLNVWDTGLGVGDK